MSGCSDEELTAASGGVCSRGCDIRRSWFHVVVSILFKLYFVGYREMFKVCF